MKREQILKILGTMMVATFLMFVFDLIFQFDSVTKPIENWIASGGSKGWIIGLLIWFVMYIQVALIPIPGMVVIQAALTSGIIVKTLDAFTTSGFWAFVVISISASMLGAMTAYWIGLKFGRKAIKWCAGSEEDYEKWSHFLNKKGKWFYAGTVLLPIFPDDLLALVAGSMSFDFPFFFWSNLVGKSIGLLTILACLCGANSLISASGSDIWWSTIFWGVALVAEIIGFIILKLYKGRKKDEKSR